MASDSDPQHPSSTIGNDGDDNASSNRSTDVGAGNETESDDLGPRPTVRQVLACQFSSWYPTFSNLGSSGGCGERSSEFDTDDDAAARLHRQIRRKNVTIPSIIIQGLPLPEFRDYLLSDGIRLPLDATKLSSFANESSGPMNRTDDYDDWSTDDDQDVNGAISTSSLKGQEELCHSANDDDDDDDSIEPAFHFPTLNGQIAAAIQSFQKAGGVMPKLNWSAPKDANWINGGSMQCKTPGDVYLLLKSSDFCLHDVLGKALEDCRDYNDSEYVLGERGPPLQLVLRKWCNLHPSMEFRCFIRHDTMIAISQRHHSQHYPHLMRDWQQIRDTLQDFWYDYIRGRFLASHLDQQQTGGDAVSATEFSSNYVVDLYLDQKDRAWILDFNPWARSTDPLLFEWSELMVMDADDTANEGSTDDVEMPHTPEMRIVETEQQVRHDPLASYRAPIDTLELASMTRGDSKQFEEFMKLRQQQEH